LMKNRATGRRARCLGLAIFFARIFDSGGVHAQPAAAPTDSAGTVPPAPSAAAPASDAVEPAPSPGAPPTPGLKEHPEAVYPPDALKQRLEGTVGLELTIDETGKVTDARVTSQAGHGFDEAALVASKQFTFEPARENGVAVRSVVEFNYEFHL